MILKLRNEASKIQYIFQINNKKTQNYKSCLTKFGSAVKHCVSLNNNLGER
jgi:hypothetical protein